jgi:hypothetical protein
MPESERERLIEYMYYLEYFAWIAILITVICIVSAIFIITGDDDKLMETLKNDAAALNNITNTSRIA